MTIEAVLLLIKNQGTNRFFLPRKKPFLNLGFGRFHSNSESVSASLNLNDALYLFDEMLHTRPLPSASSFTPFLDFVTKIKHFSCSVHCFKQMCAVGVPVNNHTASIVIKSYSRLHHTKQGLTVLACCFKQGIVLNNWTYNTLIKGFILEDKTHEAERLFKNLIRNDQVFDDCEPNLFTYNTMIKGLCKIGNNFTAVGLVRLMDGRGCKPNVDTYNTIIDSLCKDLMIYDAFKIFKGMIFNKMVAPDVITYNALINALCKLGRWDEVCKTLKQMEDERISPDMKTFNAIVDALCRQGYIKEAETVIDIMYENFDMHVDIVTVNSLINGHCLRGEMTKARKHYDRLGLLCNPTPNVDTLNIMLDGYCKESNAREAVAIYYNPHLQHQINVVTQNIFSMWKTWCALRVRPPTCDAYEIESDSLFESFFIHPYETYLQSNSGCSHTYEDKLAFFRFMDSNGSNLNSDVGVYNVMIDGAIKCGKFDTARSLFHEMSVKGLEPDVVTYKMMITGFCDRGLLKDARRLLFELLNIECCTPEVIRGYVNDNNNIMSIDDVFSVLEEITRVKPGKFVSDMIQEIMEEKKASSLTDPPPNRSVSTPISEFDQEIIQLLL